MERPGEDERHQGKPSTEEPITDLIATDSLDFLSSIAEATRDDELVDDASQIITGTVGLRVSLQKLPTHLLVFDKLLDLPRREREEVRQARDFLESCQEFIDHLRTELQVAEETARAAISEIYDARRRESQRTRQDEAERRASVQRNVAILEQRLSDLDAHRRTLEAEGVEEAFRPLLHVVDIHRKMTEALRQFGQDAVDDNTIDEFYEAHEQLVELFDLRLANSLRYLDKARSAAERQRRRAARWQLIRRVLYGLGLLTVVLGVVTDRLPLGWSLVVAAVVWIIDHFVVGPWLGRWEAGRHRDLLAQRILATGQALVLTRVFEAELANTLRAVKLQPVQLVDIQPFRDLLDPEPL
jgi:hypothetical protein